MNFCKYFMCMWFFFFYLKALFSKFIYLINSYGKYSAERKVKYSKVKKKN